jgi:hypothetical protein
MPAESSEANHIGQAVVRALYRARIPILTVALTYFVSVTAGVIMAHTGNALAVSSRDTIVSSAQSSPITSAFHRDNRLQAAMLDAGANLLGAISTTVAGLGVIFAYPLIAYRGWIGGIVSIDGSHASRLADVKEAAYYLITLVLQLIPYTLTGGAGINMGMAFLKPKPCYQGEKWLGIPKEALWDVLRIYLVAVPLFLLASLWEFLAR